jgi:signal transduction histidine kinase
VRDVLDHIGRGGRWVLVTVASVAAAGVAHDWWTTRPSRDPLPGWLAAGAVAAWLAAVPALVPGVEDRLPGASVALPLLLVATIPLLSVAVLVAATRETAWEAGMASHRFLEWLLLVASITLTYTIAVAGLGRLVGGSGPTWLLVAATGVVALLLEPVRDRIRRLVDHVLYGERSDPLTLVREVMQHVTSVADVDQLLPSLAVTVGTALRLEHVEIDVAGPAGWARSGVYGDVTTHSRTLPLVHQGEQVGQLVIGWSSGSSLRRRDRAVLDDLMTHLAQVVSWVRLTLDLRRSSLAVTSAREEERRRLRRDLHDGLGPSLTGISLGLRTGLRQLERGEVAQQARALALMANLADEVDRTVDEVKRIVRDLRPTALDERDLPSAIVDLARRMAPAVQVHLDLPATPFVLPAAIEVATYRITSEALTNVVRHASATQCWVRLRVDGAVALEVVDDGVGLAPVRVPGVGMAAMSERVTELGGTMAVSEHEPHGTRLAVTLPAVLR